MSAPVKHGQRICQKCKESKPLLKFHNDKSDKLGKHRRCKECMKGYRQNFNAQQMRVRKDTAKKWYEENKKRCLSSGRNNWLKRKYGITTAEYNTLLEKQGRRCAICERSDTDRNRQRYFPVDHDHSTGVIRGILCDQCNKGLGHFKDNPIFLRKAISYVRRSGKSSKTL